MPSTYLISRAADPFFALGVGIWAYALYEREHPRRPQHALHELLVRRYPVLEGPRDAVVRLWPKWMSSSAEARERGEKQYAEGTETAKQKFVSEMNDVPLGFEKAKDA
jgi:hypothetical protein